MTELTNQEWHNDNGRPAYKLPLIVEGPEGKRDISEWAKNQVKYDFWLCFRKGTTEYNARVWYSLKELAEKFKHGDKINGWQFIVEDLRSEYPVVSDEKEFLHED